MILVEIIMATLLAIFIHLMSHSLMCKYYTGKYLTFYIDYRYIKNIAIPKVNWTMPKLEFWKQRNIAVAGFIGEFLLALLTVFSKNSFWITYGFVITVRFLLYPYYCRDHNDYKWIR